MSIPFRITGAVLGLALLGSPPARAGFTSPTLLLASAVGAGGTSGRGVLLDGTFDFPNAIQVGYPLYLVVYQGTTFVRFAIAGTPVTGTSAALADNALSESELTSFLGQGGPAGSGTRIVTLTQSQIRVTLPSSFTAGSTRAVLFTVLPDGAVISNPIIFTLP